MPGTRSKLVKWLMRFFRESRIVILGIGVDLVELPRYAADSRPTWARRFIERVFPLKKSPSAKKLRACGSLTRARFAAKEAAVKAFGTGFSRGITPAAIVVSGGERTQPTIHLLAQALVLADSMNVSAIHVSLTHTAGSASA